MIPPTSVHVQATQRDVYYSVGVRQTGNLKESIAARHGCDSLAAQAVAELEQFLTTPAFRQTLR